MSSTPLAALERRRLEFGPVVAEEKLALLKQLAHTRLGSARAVMRLHEALCFIRAYPHDAAVLAQVQTMLAALDRRSDLRTHPNSMVTHAVCRLPARTDWPNAVIRHALAREDLEFSKP